MLSGWWESTYTGVGNREKEGNTTAMAADVPQSLLRLQNHWNCTSGLPHLHGHSFSKCSPFAVGGRSAPRGAVWRRHLGAACRLPHQSQPPLNLTTLLSSLIAQRKFTNKTHRTGNERDSIRMFTAALFKIAPNHPLSINKRTDEYRWTIFIPWNITLEWKEMNNMDESHRHYVEQKEARHRSAYCVEASIWCSGTSKTKLRH